MKAIVLMGCLLAGGCASATVDNGKCHATYSSWFKTLDNVDFSACRASGRVERSEVDIHDITDGLKQ